MRTKKVKPDNFKKICEWAERLRKRYMFTVAAHESFNELNRLNIISLKGKATAENNVNVMKKYLYFFNPAKEGLRYYVIIELAKFFEPHKSTSLTIEHLLEYTEKNIRFLSTPYFKEYHKDNVVISNTEEYEPVTLSEIKRIRKRIKRNSSRIQRIKDYRDEHIAHDDLSKKEYKFNSRDISTLLTLVKDVVNLYYKKLLNTTVIYEDFETNPPKHLISLFSHLREYDREFRKKLKRKYKF